MEGSEGKRNGRKTINKTDSERLREKRGNETEKRKFVQQMKKLLYEF
jgi:hypothetical protein